MIALSTSRGSLKRAADDRTLRVYQSIRDAGRHNRRSWLPALHLAPPGVRGWGLSPGSCVTEDHLLFLELVHLQNLAFSLQHVCIECVECVEYGGAYKTRFQRKDVNTAQAD